MFINVTEANVVILCGEEIVDHFSELANCLADRLVVNGTWDNLLFITASDNAPALRLNAHAKKKVNAGNTLAYYLDAPPDFNKIINMILDRVHNGNVNLHIVSSPDATDWCAVLRDQIARNNFWSFNCFYYFLLNINSSDSVRQAYVSLLDSTPQNMAAHSFFLGNLNIIGGKVADSERWNALCLSLLMNCAGRFPLPAEVFSLGYSVLNADGNELENIRRNRACEVLIYALTPGTGVIGDAALRRLLLPKDVTSADKLRDYLQLQIAEHNKAARGKHAAQLRNAWITTRMSNAMEPEEAVKRMRRFYDLNYTGNAAVEDAREFAQHVKREIIRRLSRDARTVCLTENMTDDIIMFLDKMSKEDVRPGQCQFPKLPLLKLPGKMEERLKKCKDSVIQTMRQYREGKCIVLYADALKTAYKEIRAWLTVMRTYDAVGVLTGYQKLLNLSELLSIDKLKAKYPRYATALDQLNPDIDSLLAFSGDVYFDENGEMLEASWHWLVEKTAAVIGRAKALDPGYRGDMFTFLKTEFNTPNNLALFFDRYLQNGHRMYNNLTAPNSAPQSIYLVDDSLMMTGWFADHDFNEVNTDNAENISLYALGGCSASDYLKNDKVYFQTNTASEIKLKGGARSGNAPRTIDLFGQQSVETESAPASLRSDPGTASRKSEQAAPAVRLDPDENNHYWLRFDYSGNDNMTIIARNGSGQVGNVAIVTPAQYVRGGNAVDFTNRVMNGADIPRGDIQIDITAGGMPVIRNAVVTGRRYVVQYEIAGNKLRVRSSSGDAIARVVLRTEDIDGVVTYYPLYPSENDDGRYLFLLEHLPADSVVVVDPTNGDVPVVTVKT